MPGVGKGSEMQWILGLALLLAVPMVAAAYSAYCRDLAAARARVLSGSQISAADDLYRTLPVARHAATVIPQKRIAVAGVSRDNKPSSPSLWLRQRVQAGEQRLETVGWKAQRHRAFRRRRREQPFTD